MRRIAALYWNNIDPALVTGQRRVFDKLGYAIDQIEATGTHHGDWIDGVLRALGPDDAALLVDIDAFPLNRDVVERAFAAAEAGRIFAIAQTADHRPDRDLIYAAPAFLCMGKATWDRIGQTSFRADATADVGMRVTQVAIRHGVALELLYPNFVAIPRWRFADKGHLGIATFYGDGSVFHLFQARAIRNAPYQQIFDRVAASTVAGEAIDYAALQTLIHSPGFRVKGFAHYLARKAARLMRGGATGATK